MKKIIILGLLTLLSVVAVVGGGKIRTNADDYIPQQVLDTSSPLNVTIDVGFLQKLTPAYEQY